MPMCVFRGLYRSLVIGLLGATVLLIAARLQGAAAPAPVPAPMDGGPRDAIVDVSQRAAGDGVIALLGLGCGERVIAIDDVAATTDQVVDAWRTTAPGRYLDLTVADGTGGSRRVLVLVHP